MTKNELLLALLKTFFSHPGKTFTHHELLSSVQKPTVQVSRGQQDKSAIRRVSNAMNDLLNAFGDYGLQETPGSTDRLRQYQLVNKNIASILKGQPEQLLLKLLQLRIPVSQWQELSQLITEPDQVKDKLHSRLYIAPETVLLKANEDPAVVTTLYQAVMQQRQLQLHYRKAGNETAQAFIFTPWGLMFKGENSYLVGKIQGKNGLASLPVHRVVLAELLPDQRDNPDSFDEKQNFVQLCEQHGIGVFASEHDPVIEVHLRFYKSGGHLFENKLAEDQQLHYLTGEQCHALQAADPHYFELEVKATVRCGRKFDEWLRSFGSEVEVLAPQSLRQEMLDELKKTVERYSRSG